MADKNNSAEFSMIKYDSGFGMVELTPDTVKNYLVKGNGAVSDQEVLLFAKMCEAQKLNPFVTGEVYLIKFGTQPAQMVIGYDTYKRRAEENPNYLYTESGIVVLRGNQVLQKPGACIYPSEQLVGGWCRVHKLKGTHEVCTYKEVGFKEYDKSNAIWKEKPCTMIEKVAISQALREAFPKDYEGLYTQEELAPAEYRVVIDGTGNENGDDNPVIIDEPITQAERQALFAFAQGNFGKEVGTTKLKKLLEEEGLTSTSGMMKSAYDRVMQKMHDELDASSDETGDEKVDG